MAVLAPSVTLGRDLALVPKCAVGELGSNVSYTMGALVYQEL